MHDILSSDFRRAIILILQSSETPLPLEEVNQQLHDWSEDENIEFHRDATRSGMEHTQILEEHVWKMVEFGILGLDPNENTVWIPDDVSFSLIPPWDTRSRPG